MPETSAPGKPLLVAIDMGYGHLRAAAALADVLGVPILELDRPPLAGRAEQAVWAQVRIGYEAVSRASQLPGSGWAFRSLLDGVTAIPPLHPARDLSAPNAAVRLLDWLRGKGLGAGMCARLRESGAPLLTTFYSSAVIAASAGLPGVHCVVTDADIHRIWVPRDPERAVVTYFAPSQRVVRRLRSYGVPAERIELTGFPLPGELLGGPDLPVARSNLAARLVRLDPSGIFRASLRADIVRALGSLPASEAGRAPLITFAVGGAGAQGVLARSFLPGLAPAVRAGRLRLALVAGVRADVAEIFRSALREAELEEGQGVDIVADPSVRGYLARMNRTLADTDVLWTKPSEMTFFAALGLPLVFAPPVGAHELQNRRWAANVGAGLCQGDPRYAGQWLEEWLADGTLAGAAWAGFTRLPNRGLYRIASRFA